VRREAWRESLKAWAYALPALALIALVNLLPVAETVRLASGWSWMPKDPRLGPTLETTLAFTAATVVIELGLGLAAALILARPFRGRGPVRAAALLPWALPTAVMAMAWRWIFNADNGVVGDLLYRAHLVATPRVPWLAHPGSAFWACVLADAWKTAPFIAILLMSALASVPEELYEAAAIDGAGPVRRFFMITLPALKPTILVAVIFRAIQAFGIFDLVWVLTGGGPAGTTQTIALYVYDTVFRYQELGYGCALTLVMTACLAAIAGLLFLLGRDREAA
jgi:multiple sugar transport system permease protein